MNTVCLHCMGFGNTWRLHPAPKREIRCHRCHGTGRTPAWLMKLSKPGAMGPAWAEFTRDFRHLHGRRPRRSSQADGMAFALWYAGHTGALITLEHVRK